MNLQQIYNYLPYSVQKILFNHHCKDLFKHRYSDKFKLATNSLEKFEKYSITEMKTYQDEKLRLLIEHSYLTVPYYNRIMKNIGLLPTDIRGSDDLYKLPVLTRKDVAENGHEMISTKFTRKQLIHGHTSGTTGSPLSFYWDHDMWFMNNVFDWRQKRWAGMELGDASGVFLGRTIVSVNKSEPPFWQYNKFENQMWFSAFHLGEKYIKSIYDELTRLQPLFLEGYPSTLYILAKLFELYGITLKLKAVLTSSEPLFESKRKVIENIFKCKVFDYYGLAERVIWGTECSHHSCKHLNMDYGITEIVDESNKPLTSGNHGYLVGTSLLNYGMPFIRYKTGDVSCIEKTVCACGCQMPLMSNVCTKQEDFIVTPAGKYISASVLTHPFKPLENVVMSQIVQYKTDEIVVNIVKNEKYCNDDSELLLSALSERLGGEINIELNFVENIEREKSGKFKWVKSYVNSDICVSSIDV